MERLVLPGKDPKDLWVFHLSRMGDVPTNWLPRLRDLSYGSEEGTFYRWSYHDGSTWACIANSGPTIDGHTSIGWACITFQEEPHPVIGVFVAPEWRGRGLARQLVQQLLEHVRPLIRSSQVYAVGRLWPQYPNVLAEAGFEYLEWD